MKKSLVIISFAFIFLLSVSVVSANFFDWITGDDVVDRQGASLPTSTPTLTLKEGRTESLSPTLDVKVESINTKTGTVEATVTNADTGVQEQISLQKDGIAQLNDGTTLNVLSTRDSGFLRKASANIQFTSPEDIGGTAGIGGTEGLTSSITSVQEGETVVDERTVQLEDGLLTIEGQFSTDVSQLDQFMLPIPVKSCYWLVTRSPDAPSNTFTFETICEAGAGLEGAGSGTGETEKGCIDTDKGSNLKVKGTTYMSDNLVDKWTDYCILSGTASGAVSSQVVEYTCVEGVVTENVHDCETTCVDGACV